MNLLITILKIKKIPDLSWSSNDPFNFKPKFNLEDGIKNFVEWFNWYYS